MKTTVSIAAATILVFTVMSNTYARTFDDGGLHNIDYEINSYVSVRYAAYPDLPGTTRLNLLPGGKITSDSAGISLNTSDNTQVTIAGGSTSRGVFVREDSAFSISSGTIGTCSHLGGGIQTDSSVPVIISGGTIRGNIDAQHSGKVIISGGIFDGSFNFGYFSSCNSIITFIGSNFAISGTPVDFGVYGEGISASITLTGTLADGSEIDNVVNIGTNSKIVLAPIPEPTTIALLALGSVVLRYRKR